MDRVPTQLPPVQTNFGANPADGSANAFDIGNHMAARLDSMRAITGDHGGRMWPLDGDHKWNVGGKDFNGDGAPEVKRGVNPENKTIVTARDLNGDGVTDVTRAMRDKTIVTARDLNGDGVTDVTRAMHDKTIVTARDLNGDGVTDVTRVTSWDGSHFNTTQSLGDITNPESLAQHIDSANVTG
jgi:hypothetical protein